jgi:hypothetical protein
MLTLLRVSGFALIDEVELSLGPGLTVITGKPARARASWSKPWGSCAAGGRGWI